MNWGGAFLEKGPFPRTPFPHPPKTFMLIESLFAVFLTQILFRIREVQLWWRAVRQEFRWMTGNSKRHAIHGRKQHLLSGLVKR